MRTSDFKCTTILKAAVLVVAILLLGAGASFAQQIVNLTAGPAGTTLPDGNGVPMWGYSCGASASGVASAATTTTYSAASPWTATDTSLNMAVNAYAGATVTAVSAAGATTGVVASNTATVLTLTSAGWSNGVPTGSFSIAASTANCAFLSKPGSPAAMGALGAISVVNGGSGYTTAPSVTITPAAGNIPTNAANAVALIASGQVVGIQFTGPNFAGSGYTSAPTVAIAAPTSGTTATATAGLAWSPVLITVPTGQGLQINLTNNLYSSLLTGTGTTPVNAIPTSIMIVGQVGGGLGTGATYAASPNHTDAQGCVTWFIANTPPGQPCNSTTSTTAPLASPPNQGPRVRSFGTEAPASLAGSTAATPTILTWSNLRPGTYLLESGTHPSIQVPMGLIGVLVVTNAPGSTSACSTATAGVGQAYPGVCYNAEVPVEFSEIDPVQNASVNAAVNTAGFSETMVWDGHTGACGDPNSTTYHQCYPPAVNYTPFYFLINGVAFNKTNASASLFAATAGVSGTGAPVTTGISGTVLVRMVNAGVRMHVPSIVGSLTQGFNGAGASATVPGFGLVAEDGNLIPNLVPSTGQVPAPRVQTDVFMAAGKVFDVMINAPATPSGSATPPALPIYDRELSLSGNSSTRDAGMVAYLGVNAATLPANGTAGTVFAGATANPDTYAAVVACAVATPQPPCAPLVVSDVSKGVIANDINVYGVALNSAVTVAGGTVALNANGTFTFTPTPGSSSGSFGYCANGTSTICTTVTLSASTLSGTLSAINQTYTAQSSTYLKIASPGLLIGNSDPNNLALSVVPQTSTTSGVLVVDAAGGFTLSLPSTAGSTASTSQFQYTLQNSQGKTATGTVTVNFPAPSGLQVNVVDAQAYNNCQGVASCISGLAPISDYRWIIEEDKTFWIDPNCTNTSVTPPPTGCPAIVGPSGTSTIPTFAVNFHTSNMDYVAQGCTGPLSCEGGQTMLDNNPTSTTFGTHIKAVCDVGNGACRPDPTGGQGSSPVQPSSVHLDPSKRYYISVLPGDAANPFPTFTSQPNCLATPYLPPPAPAGTLNTQCGHTMSGAPIPAACNVLVSGCTSTSTATFAPVTVPALPTPLPTGKLSVMVFEDDFPLNGEQDAGGGVDVLSPNEPGLGGFNIVLWDTYGGLGDVTGQDTYDDFNQPLSNSLAGTIDPSTGLDACPMSATPRTVAGTTQPVSPTGITGMIVTCPKYESDGKTLSPLAGQAVIANLMPEKFSVQAYPGADRIARGEEWIQTNTLDGQHPHDSFIRIGEPSYFQEFGPAGYHVSIGFANPAIINARHDAVCAGAYGAVGPCTNTITGQVGVQRTSRTPDQRLYPSDSRDALAWTQCWVSLGDPDAEDFMFTKCDAQGNFAFTGVPGGNWRVTIGDQWNDQIIDGLSTPANVGCVPQGTATTCSGGISTLNLGSIGVQQWQSNLYTKTCVDDNKNGICDPGEIGIPLIYTRIRYRDGHNSNSLTTDFNGVANFNETFPLFNWYVVESDPTRYKTTGIHVVYDAGGPADHSSSCGTSSNGARQCGTSTGYNNLANTFEGVPLPADLSVPGAVYCAKADCVSEANSNFVNGTPLPSSSTASTGRIDPPWVGTEAWSGMTSQGNWIEFAKAPYASCPPACVTTGTKTASDAWGENGGIEGNVEYASTRPFDSAEQMIQQPWEPFIPHVTVNLYQEGFAADGITPTLTMVDTAQSSSWDDWAQGFYPTGTAGSGLGAGQKPYMSCPGQGAATGTNADLFFYSLFGQPNYLDLYNSEHNGGTLHTLPYNAQYKCYDAMHIWNQVQPAPFDGKYSFPSILGINPTSTGGTGWLNTSLTGGVGVPVWYPSTPYAAGTTVMYGTGGTAASAFVALKANVGVVPGTTAASGIWQSAATPTSWVAAKMGGTNCTICVPNPTHGGTTVDDSYDPYRTGTPMLPPGKYVVQVIMPPGYEVYKEEDKNLLIGDNFIAPVTVQFAGLGGDIFIIPDQAAVASLYDPNNVGYNPTNYQNATTGLSLQGGMLSGVPGFPGFTDPIWPCVGEMRVVPDYLSLFPQALETAPFAGATRPLCDRKEVTLTNQMAVQAKFAIYTSTHIASKFTGVITDDFTSEFDPFSPQFGEKFAPPNLPISTRDYLGNEISRVYADHFGIYDGLTYSSWEVNPPNITGYSPTMMVQCMNDPGPIPDPAHPGQFINDPLYNPAYSNFCYEEPYMPGLTTYLDTPVVPTQAFVGAGYNNPDCAYPDATPAIAEVDSQDGLGPWVAAANHTLTITALGNATTANLSSCTAASTGADVSVTNAAYSGPSASAAPFNCKTVSRHYGFGGTKGKVSIGGVDATSGISGWTDSQIVVSVPAGVPNCAVQQQAQYGGSTAQCGELVITAANGQRSIDTVTVTIGGKQPTHVAASATIQGAIDAAAPGDLIIVDPTCGTSAGVVPCGTTGAVKSPASHTEVLIMWKPVRLQGVGAATTIINANAQPAGKLLDPWRRHINCLFGLTLQGVPYSSTVPYDSTNTFNCPDAGWKYFGTDLTGLGGGNRVPNNPQIDRLPSEGTIGWDASLNGNLAELLQEPSLMGAYEGAGITVLARGVELHGADPFANSLEGAFPTGSSLLSGVVSNPGATSSTAGPSGTSGPNGELLVGDANPFCHTVSYNSTTGAVILPATSQTNPYPSNFICNPSSIDGLSITNSSQGGGGIFIHGWAHYLQVANNRVYNNAGTLSGGISVGQGEFGPPYTQGGGLANLPPGSCSDGTGFVTNQHLPWCLDLNPNVHNNMITDNSSIGDELFSATLSGGGGATVCTGNDYYKFNFNWVCGNLSAGEGGGLVHLGEIFNGQIQYNQFVFNQSSNPTIPTNGGGIMVQGTPDTDPTCPGVPDSDCPSGLSDGTGPGLVINGNLIQGNSADSGSGGGIRLQQVNGTGVGTFPNPRPANTIPGNAAPNCATQYTSTGAQNCLWNVVSITNNVIDNNMAGWDGAGISLQDALVANIINNTIVHNDSLASSGVLTTSVGAPSASAPSTNCTDATGTTSCPQSAGVTSTLNSTLLGQAMTGLPIDCPSGHANCTHFSNPILYNDIIWQNRSFDVGVGGSGPGNLNQQNLVTLFNGGTSTPAPIQAFTGACSAGVTYWDLGVRGDTNAAGQQSGFRMSPIRSVLSSGGYGGPGDVTTEPSFVTEYCNGSRVPPECNLSAGCGGPHGFGVPPGIADAVTPNPVFSLTPSATVDEGNNWINVSWGPLSLSNPSLTGGQYGNYGGGLPLGNYALLPSSALIDTIPCPGGVAPCLPPGEIVAAPTTDFFGNPRPDGEGAFDPGAIETAGGGGGTRPGAPTLTLISPNSGQLGNNVQVTLEGTNLIGASINSIAGVTITGTTVLSSTQVSATFQISATATLSARNVTVTTSGGTSNAVIFTIVNPPPASLSSIAPATGQRGNNVAVTLTGTNFTSRGDTITVSGGGVTVTDVAVNAAGTQITATFQISATTALGARNVTATNASGTASNAVTFTIVNPPAPTLASITPNSATHPASGNVNVAVALAGNNFTARGTTVSVSGPGVFFGAITVNAAGTQIRTMITVNSTATVGAHSVTVTTPGGTSPPVTFTVN